VSAVVSDDVQPAEVKCITPMASAARPARIANSWMDL
jgi:hypothetical protein